MPALLRTLSLRQARCHPTRTILLVLTVALGVAAWIATNLLDQSLEAALRSAATPSTNLADLHVANGEIGVPLTLADRLATVPGIRAVHPVLTQRVLLTEHGGRPAVLLGVDLAAQQQLARDRGLIVPEGTAPSFVQALLRRQNPVLIGAALDRELRGENAQFPVLVAGRSFRLTRVGTIDAQGAAAALGGYVLLTDLKIAARLTGRPDRASRLDVLLDPGADSTRVRSRLESALKGSGQVFTPEASDQRTAEALAGLRIGFSLGGAGALGLGLFLVASTIGVVAAQRRPEIGVLRSLGAARFQIARLLLGEAAILGAGGSIIGIPLGFGLAGLALGPLFGILSDVFLPLESRRIELDAATLASGMAAGVATTVLAALLPIVRTTCQTPVQAMSRAPADAPAAPERTLLIAALILWGLGAACTWSVDGLAPRLRIFGTLLLILLGTVLAFPAIVALAARGLRPVAGYVLGLPGRLAADHLARTPGQSGFVVAALAGGTALILQTGGVIQGNAAAIQSWVDRCIAGDLFVTSGGPLSASGQILPMPAELGSRIEAALPGSQAVPMRFRSLDWRQAGRPTRILLLALDARRYAEVNQGRRPPLPDLDLYRQLASPGAVLVSENFAALNRIKVGETIALAGADGPVSLRVIGTITDFSCNRGTVVLDRVRYGARFDAEGVDVFSVLRPSTTTDEAARRRIQQAPWTTEQALCVLTRTELRRHILGMVDRLYAVAYLQEVAAALVAALGVAAALGISILQRKSELGLLRALGATPQQARHMILSEALLLTLFGLISGLVIGVALEWYVLRVVLLEETGFVFPFRFPWFHAVIVTLLVSLSGALASLGPVLSAARLRISEAIAFE
jgi:putative ABC transport system permease protein